jgi:hypothetical protein
MLSRVEDTEQASRTSRELRGAVAARDLMLAYPFRLCPQGSKGSSATVFSACVTEAMLVDQRPIGAALAVPSSVGLCLV